MESKEKSLLIRQFFALLRAGLGKEPADSGLFCIKEKVDWNALLRISEEQTVVAVVWDGMLTLPQKLHPQKAFFYQWLAKVLAVEKSNARMNGLLPEIVHIVAGLNVPVAVLKGQGTGALYPNPSHRQSGDIDLYSGTYNDILQRSLPQMGFVATDYRNGKHSELIYKEVVVENHYCIEEFFYPPHRKAFAEMVDSWYPSGINYRTVSGTSIPIPPSWFEALLGVAHFGKHLLCSGVGLRHLCDWAVIMSTQLPAMEQERFLTGIKKLGLEDLTSAMAELSVTYLGFDKEELGFLIRNTRKSHERAELLLKDTLRVGNFGQYDTNYTSGKGIKGFIRFIWRKAKRNYTFWPFYRIEALLLPIAKVLGRVKPH